MRQPLEKNAGNPPSSEIAEVKERQIIQATTLQEHSDYSLAVIEPHSVLDGGDCKGRVYVVFNRQKDGVWELVGNGGQCTECHRSKTGAEPNDPFALPPAIGFPFTLERLKSAGVETSI